MACSALRQSYRAEVVVDPSQVKLVYLKGTRALIADRLAHRRDHFMNAQLLQSQFDSLEEPRDAITIDVRLSPPRS